MALKACKQCKTLFEGSSCTACGSKESTDNFKGKVYVSNPEQSEIANKLVLKSKGLFALRLR
jgi:DNA-directed RNA polymerase subunit E"